VVLVAEGRFWRFLALLVGFGDLLLFGWLGAWLVVFPFFLGSLFVRSILFMERLFFLLFGFLGFVFGCVLFLMEFVSMNLYFVVC